LFLENHSYVETYRQWLAAIADLALDRRQSREMLAAMASDFDDSEDSLDGQHHLAKEQRQHKL
jgi:hypothetical protein